VHLNTCLQHPLVVYIQQPIALVHPGAKVDLPVLMQKDIDDLQQFAAKHEMDFVAASFVQTKEDVLNIRQVLDDAGGHNVRIISKIENQEGLKNFDSILEVTDGVQLNQCQQFVLACAQGATDVGACCRSHGCSWRLGHGNSR
jgi:hypothetical protein